MTAITMDPVIHLVDINAMSDEHTGHWLAENRLHVAAIPEIAMIETFKGDVRHNLHNNFKILKQFHNQCWLMKPSSALRGIPVPGYVRDAIDWDGTDRIKALLLDLLIGYENLPQYAIESNKEIALRRVDIIARNVAKNRVVLPRIEGEIRRCLNGRDRDGIPTLSRKGLNKVKNFTIQLAWGHARMDGIIDGDISLDAFVNSFTFRFAASCVALFVNRVANGNMASIGNDKLRNDVLDAEYMACATFVQGFRSYDEQTRIAYQILTKRILT